MIVVEVSVTEGNRLVPARLFTITNVGPIAPDEAWDPGGERRYRVQGNDGQECTVRHFRRDGLMPLVVRALVELGEWSGR